MIILICVLQTDHHNKVNSSFISHNYHVVVITFKIYFLSNFRVLQYIVVNCNHCAVHQVPIRTPLVTGSLYPLTTSLHFSHPTSPHYQSLATTSLRSSFYDFQIPYISEIIQYLCFSNLALWSQGSSILSQVAGFPPAPFLKWLSYIPLCVLRHTHTLPYFLLTSQPSVLLLLIVQLLICILFFVTPWTAAYQASLSFTISRHLPEFAQAYVH